MDKLRNGKVNFLTGCVIKMVHILRHSLQLLVKTHEVSQADSAFVIS